MSRNAPQISTTASTGNAIPVSSSVGFAAGELIYSKNNDAGTIPNNALSTASFAVTSQAPVIAGGIFPTATLISTTNGSSSSNQAAKLTNGNIVQVTFRTTDNYPVFTVVNTAGATVVAETVISSTYTSGASCGQIGAVALSGGGFAVYWINGAGGATYFPCYAIYSNTGSVVVAATQDTTLAAATANTTISGCAIPSGGFALAYVRTSNSNPYLRAYSATGVGAYAWTTGGSVAYQPFGQIGVSARSDDSVIMVWQTATQLFQYMLLNSSGGAVANSTFTGVVSNIANLRSSDVTTLADGTTFVIAYNIVTTSGIYNCFRFLPTGNVLGSEFYIPLANLNLTSFGSTNRGAYGVKVKGLSTGGFIFLFTDQAPSWNYAFFNSSGVCVSGTSGSTGTAAICYNIPFASTAIQSIICPVEISGYINLYWSQGVYNQNMTYQQSAQINSTTYQLVASQYLDRTVGAVSASVNAYSKSGSTPTGAKFVASSSTTSALSKTFAYSVTPTTVGTGTCVSIYSATAPDGSFVIVYVLNTGSITLNSYSSGGALLQTVAVGTKYSASNYYSARVTVLSGGKVVVAYQSDANTATLAMFTGGSGNYSLSASTTVSGIQNTSESYQFGIAGLTGDRVIFCYAASSGGNVTYTLYDNTLTLLTAPTILISANPSYNVNCCAAPNGGFGLTFYFGSNGQRSYLYKNTTGNTFVQVMSFTPGGDTMASGKQIAVTPGNNVFINAASSAGSHNVYCYDVQQNVLGNISYSVSSQNGGFNVGLTGLGSLVAVQIDGSGSKLWGMTSGLNGGTTTPNANSQFTLTGATAYASTGNAQVCLTPTAGDGVVIAWINSAQTANFAIVTAFPTSTPYTITSGVTTSQSTAISPSTSGSLNGYVFQGVSLTPASAGGTGLVQTNGLATLNSNYSASTAAAAFDYTKPNGTGIDGVKGTIVGRTVNLQGNS